MSAAAQMPAPKWVRWDHPRNGEASDIRQEMAPYLKAWAPYIKPGATCVDIGAWTGDTTVPMAWLAGPKGHVFAFEPNPAVFPTLAANALQDPTHFAPISAIKAAAWVHSQQETFHYSDEAQLNGGFRRPGHGVHVVHNYPVRVECVNILKFLKPSVSFIKLDTEGNDHTILKHLRPFLKKWRPVIHTEFFPDERAKDRKEHADFLRALGYKLHHMEGAPATDFEIQSAFMIDILAIP